MPPGASAEDTRPMRTVPTMPPTRWTPTTSSESSIPSLNFRPTARAHSTPATKPIASAPTTLTEPQDGVMATRPATMPDAAPSEVALPSRMRSVSSHASIAAAVATVVVTIVEPAVPFDEVAEPALKPYQPNHSRPAPSITNGRLCGRIGVPGQPLRLPRTMARTNAAVPALMCTAVPPAKSIAASLLAIQPPVSAVPPSNENTQCATGKYTNVTHSAENTNQPPNLMRSATAPEISATVMIANISWNATKTVAGKVKTSGMLIASAASTPAAASATTASAPFPPIRPFSPKNCVGSPKRLPTSLPNASE